MYATLTDHILSTELNNSAKAKLLLASDNKESFDLIIEGLITYTTLNDDQFEQILNLVELHSKVKLDVEEDLEFITEWRQYLIQNKKRIDTVRFDNFTNADWIANLVTHEQATLWESIGVFDPVVMLDLVDIGIEIQDAKTWIYRFTETQTIGYAVYSNKLSLQDAKSIVFGVAAK